MTNRRMLYWCCAALVVLMPALVGSILLALVTQKTFFDFTPFWSDELFHWHQAATFARAGFEGGYYTVSEVTAPVSYAHFYAWGAFTPAFYGTIWRLTGWGITSGLFSNLILLGLATAVLIYRTRPTLSQLGWLGVLLATFVPTILYVPSNMQQILHQAIALSAATGFVLLLRSENNKRSTLMLVILLLLASLVRPTWGLLLLPALVLAVRQRGWRWMAGAAGLAVIVVASMAAIFHAHIAPYPYFRTSFLDHAEGSIVDRLLMLLRYVALNVTLLDEGPATAIMQRLQLAGLGVALLLLLVRAWRRRDPAAGWQIALHLYNLGVVFLFAISLHEVTDGRDYRVVAPHLLLSAALLVLQNRRWLVGLLVASMLALWLPIFPYNVLDQYREGNLPRYSGVIRQQIERWSSVLDGVLRYDADAPSPWCNTVSASFFYVVPAQGEAGLVLSIPAGMGLSFVWAFDAPGFPNPPQFRARYLMLTDDDYRAWQAQLNVRPLVTVQNGTLYENLDSACR
jgi:hypothetical protein